MSHIPNSNPAAPGFTVGAELIAPPGGFYPLHAAAAVAASAAVDAAQADPEPTPKKKAGRPKKVVAPKTESAVDGADGNAADAEPATPKAPAKRGRKPKTPNTNEDGEVVSSAAKSSSKRGATKAADGETPSKKPKATPAKAAAAGKTPFPNCWEEFTAEDKLIVHMRRNKSNWGDIEAAWEVMSGKKPGVDVIRKKYAKLEAVATIFAPGDAAKLAAAKIAIDGQLEEQIKKIRADKWNKIAEEMKARGGGQYKAAAIEKKFDHMVKNNHVNAAGVYTGPNENAPATNGHAATGDDDTPADGEGSDIEDTDPDAEGVDVEA